jgi:hypothetical protein
MSRVLKAADILESADLEIRDVPVPEWGKDDDGSPKVVRLQQLSAEELIKLTDEMEDKERSRDGIFIILVRCAIDDNGAKLFTDDDVARLRKKNMRVLNRLQREALDLNGMVPEKAKNA